VEKPTKPRLMIVEDDPDLRILVEMAANRAEVYSHIETVSDGEAALARIRELAATAGQPGCPDVVFTDLDMPGLTGIQLTRELQRDPATRHIRVAVFTASNIPHDNDAARAAGCYAVFKKPVGLRELTEIMRSLPFGPEAV
jgi:CheY-like chemotaxis protein